MDFTDEQFDTVKQSAEELYKILGEVYCPYLKEKVSFNAQGLEHLSFKKRNVMRPIRDQFMRFKLFHFAPQILTLSHTLQGVSRRMNFEWMRINSRNECVLKPVLYYEFIAVLEEKRMRIVVKQIEASQKLFWSIIPFWTRGKLMDTRTLSYGDPELD
jgi:hypothetical protein